MKGETKVNPREIKEQELGRVSGGSGGDQKCKFSPAASGTTRPGADPSYFWIGCRYGSAGCWGCCCHGTEQCVDRWHKVDAITEALLPKGFANHNLKSFTKDYSEPKLP